MKKIAFWSERNNDFKSAYMVRGILRDENGSSLEDILEEWPDTEVIPYIEACKKKHFNKIIQVVDEITKEAFDHMLEMLPPLHFISSSAGVTFKLNEFCWDAPLYIYCEYDGRYFQLRGYESTTHYEIISKVRLFFEGEISKHIH